MIKDKAGKGIVGHVSYKAVDTRTGEIVYEHAHNIELGEHNTVCDLYYDLIADRMAGGSDTLVTHGHAGTGTGQSASDTNLATPCAEARTAIDSKTQGGGGNEHIMTVIFTLGAGVCTATITEVGLFPSSTYTNADMQLYDDSINYAKGASDSLEVTWTITHSN